jgi:predicted kinase
MEKIIKKLILTRGIPGSGKSTWAKSWVSEDPEHRIRFNWDDMRNMMGPYWVPSREHINKHILWAAVNAAAYNNRPYDIVIDNMNLNPKDWKQYEDWILNYNNSLNSEETNTQYVLEFKDFFTPIEECVKRDSMRINPIGEKTIREIYSKYRHFIQTTNVEKYVNNLVKPDPNKPYCVVIDMDSTMCFNTNKRPWYGKGAAEEMINDIENFGVCETVWALMQEYPIIVATGRDTSQEEVTRKWLSQHRIDPVKYYFRTEGDYRKGTVVKKEQIEKIMKDYNILVIFEDSEPIVQMYRDMGLTVLQPNKGI